VAGFHDTIWIGVAIVAVGLVCALFLRPAGIGAGGDVRDGDGADGDGSRLALTTAEPNA
jgi:hypothetical protein